MIKAKLRSALADPRTAIFLLLGSFLVMGFTILGFNRSPSQALFTTTLCITLDVLLRRMTKGVWVWPLSAAITSFSLSILLDYPHQYHLLIYPAVFAILPKYIFTYRGRHWFNPALTGVTLSCLFLGDFIGLAPPYQWNGLSSMSLLILTSGVLFLLPRINRHFLVLSFVTCYVLTTAFRAYWLQSHLPFETVFVGALTTPAFFLFTLFMLTDPPTSPSARRDQILVGAAIAVFDLGYHLLWSYYTLFYAAATVAAFRWVVTLAQDYRVATNFETYLHERRSEIRRATFALAGVALLLAASPSSRLWRFSMNQLNASNQVYFKKMQGVLEGYQNQVLLSPEEFDPQIQHIALWLASPTECVATGDFDGDGRQDLFFCNTHSKFSQRNWLFKNLGDFNFARVSIPALQHLPPTYDRGISVGAEFVDYDNDGDQDLFVLFFSGESMLLKNRLVETGRPDFVDVSKGAGVNVYTNAISALFLDADRDGRLDLLIAGAMPEYLPEYQTPQKMSVFHLPIPEYVGDVRPTAFLNESWTDSKNGGSKFFLKQNANGEFEAKDFGFRGTRSSMALGSADINDDGWPDVYIANDFGPDELYVNQNGREFRSVRGHFFGEIGRDTYKGMNVTFEDFDRNGFIDLYVSNVHVPSLTEGSLLWSFDLWTSLHPEHVIDRASALGVVNEGGHGWGAGAADFNNDGWIDLVQTNGMIARQDGTSDNCPDYWYFNEKLNRAPTYIHRNAAHWPSFDGKCASPNQPVRLYMGIPNNKNVHFEDIALGSGLNIHRNTRGAATVDLDNDGQPDLVMTSTNGPPLIFKTEVGLMNHNRWIGLHLVGDGQTCNRDAIGTTVKLLRPFSSEEALAPQTRRVAATNGYMAQNDRRTLFGLGPYAGPVDIEINWCGHLKQKLEGLKSGEYHRIAMRPLENRRE